jgi:hypothetical protein
LFPFPVSQSLGTVAQQFMLKEYKDRMMDDLSPVSLEILVLPLRYLRRLLKRLIDGEKLSETELATVYGSSVAHELMGKQSEAVTIIMGRLSACYRQAHARYEAMLRRALDQRRFGEPEFRVAYKLSLKASTFCGPFLYPGTRSIDCQSPAAAKCALALIGEFIEIYFGHEKRNRLTGALSIVAEIFQEKEDGYFIVDDPQLRAALYIAEVSKLIGNSGNAREVVVQYEGGSWRFGELQRTPFGREMKGLACRLREGEAVFMGLPLCVVDLPLIRCLRGLVHFEGGAIVRFPATVEDYSLFSTLHQVREGDGLILACSTNFSPTADDEP